MFTSLHHLIDGDWMSEAYRRTRKDGATGIDGVTADDYEKDLEANLESLLNRIKSGSYRAPPVRRHYIPKADGTKRPLGIPTFEDKVAQRAILMLLEPIYETDFLPFSYGFRRGRSAHDALSALRTSIIGQRQRWVIDADISKYFDSIAHSHLRSFFDLRIKDGVARRMIDKWLKAGTLEEDALHRPVAGTPQGEVISPMLSNVYPQLDRVRHPKHRVWGYGRTLKVRNFRSTKVGNLQSQLTSHAFHAVWRVPRTQTDLHGPKIAALSGMH